MPGLPTPNIMGRNNTNHGFGGTYYNPIGAGNFIADTTEADNQVPFRTAGRLSNLRIRVPGAPTGDSSVTIRQNGVDSAITIPVPNGGSDEFSDDVNSIAIAAGDLLGVKVVAGGASGNFGISYFRTLFTPDTPGLAVKRYLARIQITLSTASTSRFGPICGSLGSLTSASPGFYQQKMPKACTLKNMYVYVSSNSRVTDTTFRLQINGSNTTIVITVPGGSTGLFEDTTHTEAVAAGDLVNYSYATGTGTQNLVMEAVGIEGHFTNSGFVFLSGTPAGIGTNFNLTRWMTIEGLVNNATAESSMRQDIGVPFTAKNLYFYISANSLDGDASITLKKNGSATSITIPITAGTTGLLSDLTHTEKIVPTDELYYELVTTGTTGSINLRHSSLQADVSSSLVFPSKNRHNVLIRR